MPADRGFPRFLPRSADLKIAFDEPSSLTSAIEAHKRVWESRSSERTPTLEEWRDFHCALTTTVEQGLDLLGNRLSSK